MRTRLSRGFLSACATSRTRRQALPAPLRQLMQALRRYLGIESTAESRQFPFRNTEDLRLLAREAARKKSIDRRSFFAG